MNKSNNPRESPWYLLQNINDAKVWRIPYPIVMIPNALPWERYESLRDQFPDLVTKVPQSSEFQVNTIHQVMNSEHEFTRVNQSSEFVEDVLEILQAHFGDRAVQDIHIRPQWTIQYCRDLHDYKVRELHIDKRNKVFNSFLYVPQEQDVYGGDFQIFTPRLHQVPLFDVHRRVINTFAMQHIDTIPYQSNTFFAFLNDPWSIHRVGLRKGSAIPRQSINIVAEWKEFEDTVEAVS